MASGRPASELIVLLVAGTVCAVVAFTVLGIIVVEIVNPEANTGQIAAIMGDILNTLIGLAAGLLAGSAGRSR